MATESTLDELRSMSVRAGLNLNDEELQKLLPGVNRSRRQALELRQLLSDEIEPGVPYAAVMGT